MMRVNGVDIIAWLISPYQLRTRPVSMWTNCELG